MQKGRGILAADESSPTIANGIGVHGGDQAWRACLYMTPLLKALDEFLPEQD